MRPTDCPKCRDYFMGNRLLQVEMRHLAIKLGPATAESALNDRLESIHEEHEEDS